MTQCSTRPNSFPQNDCQACWRRHSCKQERRSSLMKGKLERYIRHRTTGHARNTEAPWKRDKKRHTDMKTVPVSHTVEASDEHTQKTKLSLKTWTRSPFFLNLLSLHPFTFFGVNSPYLPMSGCLSVEVSKGGLVFTYSQRPGERWGHR